MKSGNVRAALFSVAALIVLLDRITKLIVAARIALNTGSVTIIPGLFSITHVENRGAAFSLLSDAPTVLRLGVLVTFSGVAMVVVAWLLWRTGHVFSSTTFGLALVLGGAAGNLWDRIVHQRVTDFLHFYIGDYSWPDFNVADSAIVIGACLLIAEIVFGRSSEATES